MNMGCRRAELGRFRGDFFQAVNAPGAKQQVCAFDGKSMGGSRAKTAGCAGDENPFVFEGEFHNRLLAKA
jgi:hypothetical protein